MTAIIDPGSVAAALIEKAEEDRKRNESVIENDLKPRFTAAVEYLKAFLSQIPVQESTVMHDGRPKNFLSRKVVSGNFRISISTALNPPGTLLVVADINKTYPAMCREVSLFSSGAEVREPLTWTFEYDFSNGVAAATYTLQALETVVATLKSPANKA